MSLTIEQLNFIGDLKRRSILKAFGADDDVELDLEKAGKKDISKLIKKVITDKRGHKKTVYVKHDPKEVIRKILGRTEPKKEEDFNLEKFEKLKEEFNANRHGEDYSGLGWEFNIKNPPIPKELSEIKDEELANSIFLYASEAAVEQFANQLKKKYGWIEDVTVSGRMGGWLVIQDREDYGDLEDSKMKENLNKREENLLKIKSDVKKKLFKYFEESVKNIISNIK